MLQQTSQHLAQAFAGQGTQTTVMMDKGDAPPIAIAVMITAMTKGDAPLTVITMMTTLMGVEEVVVTITKGDAPLIAIAVMIPAIAEGDAPPIAIAVMITAITKGGAPLTVITTVMGVEEVLVTVTVAVAAVKMMAMVAALKNTSTGMTVGQVVDVDVAKVGDVVAFRKVSLLKVAWPICKTIVSGQTNMNTTASYLVFQAADSHAAIPDLPSSLSCCYVLTLNSTFIKVGLHDNFFNHATLSGYMAFLHMLPSKNNFLSLRQGSCSFSVVVSNKNI